jgi:CDP-diacylglycerol--serine O-phosphatidyltransferase
MTKFPLYKAIPSLFTISAFIFGFYAIKLAIAGNIKGAIFSVIIASILDLFDGRLARLLSADSKFGAELDSLSDLVCFGIAASFIALYFQNSSSKLMYIGVCFYSVGALLRLARFNLDIQYPDHYKGLFVGVPTPAGFILAILPICYNQAFGTHITTFFYAIYLIVIGFLMVSTIPTISTKSLKVSSSIFPLILGICGLSIISLIFYTWIAISIIGTLYLISILYCLLLVQKRKLAINKY